MIPEIPTPSHSPAPSRVSPEKQVIAVIPARLASTRLPRKVLRPIHGEPLLAWTVAAAKRCPQLNNVIVAVDSDEVATLCEQRGWTYVRTAPELPSGTDRMHAVAQMHPAAIYVNLQGDEPTITPAHIDALLKPFAKGRHVEVTTVRVRCTPENRNNPNAVKVVTAADGRALYFSRSTIPYDRDGLGEADLWKHIGLYAYRAAALQKFATLPVGELERTEKLEQLRLLEHGIALYVETVEQDTVGIDTEEDLARVAELLKP